MIKDVKATIIVRKGEKERSKTKPQKTKKTKIEKFGGKSNFHY